MTEAAAGDIDPVAADLVHDLISAVVASDSAREQRVLTRLDEYVSGPDAEDDLAVLDPCVLTIHVELMAWLSHSDEFPADAGRVLDATVHWLDRHQEDWAAGNLLLIRAAVDEQEDDLDDAEIHLRAAEQRLRDLPEFAAAQTAFHRGQIRLRQDQLAEAEAQFTIAARLSAQTDQPEVEAESLLRLGQLAATAGRHQQAWVHLRDAGRAFEDLDEEDTARECALTSATEANTAATEALDRGENDDAIALWAYARSVVQRTGDAGAAAAFARNLAVAESAQRNDAAALAWFETAERELGEYPNNEVLGSVYLAWGNHAITRGDVVTADRVLREARIRLRAAGATEAAAATLTLLSAVAYQRGDRQEAARLAELAAQESDDPEMALVAAAQSAFALSDQGDYGSAAIEFRALRERCLELGLPARAFGAALGELHAIALSGQIAEAERLLPTMVSLLAKVASDPVYGSLAGSGTGALAMLRALLARRRGDPAQAMIELIEAHGAMVQLGSPIVGARIAVSIAELAASLDQHTQAVWFAVPALMALDGLQHTLPNSRERQVWQQTIAHAAAVAFTGAARIQDRLLIADLLEVVRGHGIPEPVTAQDGSLASLSSILAEVTRAAQVPEQETQLKPPITIEMPWHRPALARFHASAASYGLTPGERLAQLEVPR